MMNQQWRGGAPFPPYSNPTTLPGPHFHPPPPHAPPFQNQQGLVMGGHPPPPHPPAPPAPPPQHPPCPGSWPPRQQPTVAQVQAAALQQTARVVAEGGYGGFSDVLCRVLADYGAPEWGCLGLGPSPLAVPCLEYLWRVEQQIGNFVAAFTGLKGIATLADLEAEAVLLLRGFCIPPLEEAFPRPPAPSGPGGGPRSIDPTTTKAGGCETNPEEIQLPSDEDEDEEDADDGPEETDLPSGGDDEDYKESGTEAPKKYCFESFGLGPLVHHPAVLHYFQPSPALLGALSAAPSSAPGTTGEADKRGQQHLPTASELFPYLLSFRGSREGQGAAAAAAGSYEGSADIELGGRAGVHHQRKRHRSGNGGEAADAGERSRGSRDEAAAMAAKFGEFLAAELGVEDIRELGIRLSPSGLATEIQLLRHVEVAQRAAAAAEARRALDELHRREATQEASAKAGKLEAAAQRGDATTKAAVPSMKVPPNKDVAGFVAACEAAIEGPWRPTAAKMRAAVEAAFGGGSVSSAVAERSRQRKLLEVATEYAMLHLGGSKFRLKRLEWTDAEGEKDQEGEGEDQEEEMPETCADGGSPARAVEGSSAKEGGGPIDAEGETEGQRRLNVTEKEEGSSSSEDEEEEEDSSSSDDGAGDKTGDAGPEKRAAGNAPGAASTRVLLQAGLPPPRHAVPWEGSLRPPQEQRQGHQRPEVVEASEIPACVPWHQALDTRDSFAVGRWGEALVFQFLVSRYPGWTVKWINIDGESKAAYDIEMLSPSGALHETQFVEVKTSARGDRNAFEMSLWEWEFAAKARKQYSVMRVSNAGRPGQTRIRILDDPYRAVTEHRMGLCLVY